MHLLGDSEAHFWLFCFVSTIDSAYMPVLQPRTKKFVYTRDTVSNARDLRNTLHSIKWAI